VHVKQIGSTFSTHRGVSFRQPSVAGGRRIRTGASSYDRWPQSSPVRCLRHRLLEVSNGVTRMSLDGAARERNVDGNAPGFDSEHCNRALRPGSRWPPVCSIEAAVNGATGWRKR